jgi:serine/threonine protein kinase
MLDLIEEIIGAGGEGVVFKAKNLKTNEIVAVKRYGFDKPKGPYDPPSRAKEEIFIATNKDFSSKYLMKYIDNFEFEDYIYAVMEYCEKGDLRKLISNLHDEKIPLNEEVCYFII